MKYKMWVCLIWACLLIVTGSGIAFFAVFNLYLVGPPLFIVEPGDIAETEPEDGALDTLETLQVETLETLRVTSRGDWYDERVSPNLALMSDAAVPFLIQTLTDESRNARYRAAHFLENDYRSLLALPALTEVFLQDTDETVRHRAAWAIAAIDFAYARQLMLQHLEIGKRDVALDTFLDIADKHVIPMLVAGMEVPETRKGAAFALAAFTDARALPALTEVFLQDADNDTRRKAALEIAALDGAYARQFMRQHLINVAETETEEIAFEVLLKFRDERVIPTLVKRLQEPAMRTDAALTLAEAFKDNCAAPVLLEMLGDRKLDKRMRERATFALIDVRDNRAVPLLLEMLNDTYYNDAYYKERFVEKLAQTKDERAIPALLNLLDSSIKREVVNAFPQFGPTIVPLLLDRLRETESRKLRGGIVEILGKFHHPELAPLYGQLSLEDDELRLTDALANMGAAGFEPLLKIANQKAEPRALDALSSYNSAAAVDAVAALALNKSYPRRLKAISTLNGFGKLWAAEIAEYIPRLLAEPNPEIKLKTMNIIRQLGLVEMAPVAAEIAKHIPRLLAEPNPEIKLKTMNIIGSLRLVEMAPALQELTQTSDARMRNAAHRVLAVLSGETPLKLELETSQARYDFAQSIALTYRLTNISAYPVHIAVSNFLDSHLLSLEIQQPDGTLAEAKGGSSAKPASPRLEDYETLQPGDNIMRTISIPLAEPWKHAVPNVPTHLDVDYSGHASILVWPMGHDAPYWLYQPGRYTAQLRIRPRGSGLSFGFRAWTRTLLSPKIHFEINPPAAYKFNAMLTRIEPGPAPRVKLRFGKHVADEVILTCYQLGELRQPAAIPVLKRLALLDEGGFITRAALSALANFSDPGLVPMWINILEEETQPWYWIIEVLAKRGDTRATVPLKRIVFTNSNAEMRGQAAFVMQQLGDDTGAKWLRAEAQRKLLQRDERQREAGAHLLYKLWNPIHQSSADPQFYRHNIDSRDVSEWEEMREKSMTVSGLKELLAHKNPVIQREAAYELAYRGDASGVHLIEPDLQANDAETRRNARWVLLRARAQ